MLSWKNCSTSPAMSAAGSHRDINGYEGEPGESPPRGPFNTEKTADWRAAEYPMLWAHNAARETRLVVEPDTQGTIRPGMEELADQKWATRSRLHFTLDFTAARTPGRSRSLPLRPSAGLSIPTASARPARPVGCP